MEKFQLLRVFNSLAVEYARHPSEATASSIQRSLGAISALSDPSVFEPGISAAASFFVNLHELMVALDSCSSLIWTAVDVLQAACRNIPARSALIHTYKFAPILTRLLETNLTSEKRIRALKLLQELTYGVRISWQEAHLPYLIQTLSQWVTQSNEEEVITLSLGVLVNLCYKNPPAVYALMRHVNTKTFLQSVMKTRGQNINIKVQCCKLLIILEPTNCDMLHSYIVDVASVTFANIIPSLESEDVLLLRHIVDFFDDIRQNDSFRTVLVTYESYDKDLENLLETLKSVSNQECASLIMEFLLSLVKLKIDKLVKLYPTLTGVAVSWVPMENVCSKALSLIRGIVVDSKRTKNNLEVLEKLDLTVLTLLIKENDDMDGRHSESSVMKAERNLTELMQLFQELIKTPATRNKLLEVFTIQKMRVLVREILEGNSDSSVLVKPSNLFQDPSTEFHIHALALVADLATNNTHWLTLYTELVQKKLMQKIMAIGLFTGSCDVKQKVLQLTSTLGFPKECISAVARCMADLEPQVLLQEKTNFAKVTQESKLNGYSQDALPIFSKSQESRLDSLIAKVGDAFAREQISDVVTSDVMELYEYKMGSMRHAERTMQASLESATNHATGLQHRLAQLVAQASQVHQVLFNTQQCLEGVKTEKYMLIKKLQETEEKTQRTHTTQVQEIKGLKKIVKEKESQIDANLVQIKDFEKQIEEIPVLHSKLKVLKASCADLESKLNETLAKNVEMTKLLHKSQENINRKDQIIEEKSREITSNSKDIAALNQEIQQTLQQCRRYQTVINEKEGIIQKLKDDLNNLSRMRDMIFELTAKKQENLS